MLDITELNDKLVSELREIAKSYGVENSETLRKQELIRKISEQQELISTAKEAAPVPVAAEDEAAPEKPRKRTRTIKGKPAEKKKPDVPLDDVTLFDLPVEDENGVAEADEDVPAEKEVPAAPEPLYCARRSLGGDLAKRTSGR